MLKKLLSIMASATIAVSSAFFIFPTAITVKAIVTGPHINVADKTYSIAAGSDTIKQLYAYSDTAEIDSNLISGITYTWTKTDPQNIISEVSTNTNQYGSFLSITMSNIITDPNATATITITGTYNTSQTITSAVTVAVAPDAVLLVPPIFSVGSQYPSLDSDDAQIVDPFNTYFVPVNDVPLELLYFVVNVDPVP